jgi:hypothetical protein
VIAGVCDLAYPEADLIIVASTVALFRGIDGAEIAKYLLSDIGASQLRSQ